MRWFAAPAREALWTDLAAGRASLDKTKGWPLVALSLALWISAAVVGLAAVVVAAISDWDWAWALAAVGACLLTVGLVAAVGVTLLRRARRRLADGVTRRLGDQDA